jgi:uncharacterized protein
MLVMPLLLVIACWVISQWAAGATGQEMALEFLSAMEVKDVQVIEHNAMVSDYFDPTRRRLFLRKEHAQGTTLAAWTVAMHEAAHALQTTEDMDALRWRQSCIRMSRYLPTLTAILVAAAMFLMKMPFRTAFMLGAGCLALILMMNLGTLAIEKNANQRLLLWLTDRFSRQPALLDKLENLLGPMATRELGDLAQSPRYFFFSALPGSGKLRPR